MIAALQYAQSTSIVLESDYPYFSGTTQKKGACQLTNDISGKVTVNTITQVTPNSADELKAAIAITPVSIAIEADTAVFQSYSSGVLNSSRCGTSLDHGVLAVGYGTDATQGDYYIVKNSWGSSWGESGYIRIAVVDGAGICGIQMEPVYATVN